MRRLTARFSKRLWRDRPRQAPRSEPGSVFDVKIAEDINRARLEHLASLDLPIRGRRVLDVGAGVGKLAGFFLERECEVVCVDGRAENIEELKRLRPSVEAHALDVEVEPLSRLGRFDVVFCYGLLYHLESPLRGLRNMASVCNQLLLLETAVCDHSSPVLLLEEEPAHERNQALGGVGTRPSPAFVRMALSLAGFEYIYEPRSTPEHEDFIYRRRGLLESSRDGHMLRAVFVASRHPLPEETLMRSVPDQDERP